MHKFSILSRPFKPANWTRNVRCEVCGAIIDGDSLFRHGEWHLEIERLTEKLEQETHSMLPPF